VDCQLASNRRLKERLSVRLRITEAFVTECVPC